MASQFILARFSAVNYCVIPTSVTTSFTYQVLFYGFAISDYIYI